MEWIALYLLFNVGIPSYIRLFDVFDPAPLSPGHITFKRSDYFITLIPVFGLLYGLFLIFRKLFISK